MAKVAKKKTKKNVQSGICHIQSTFNNIEQAVAHAGHQPLSLQLGAARHLPVDLAEVNNHAIGIGQGKHAEVAALRQADDDARESGLDPQARIGDGGLGRCRNGSPDQKQQAENPANCTHLAPTPVNQPQYTPVRHCDSTLFLSDSDCALKPRRLALSRPQPPLMLRPARLRVASRSLSPS